MLSNILRPPTPNFSYFLKGRGTQLGPGNRPIFFPRLAICDGYCCVTYLAVALACMWSGYCSQSRFGEEDLISLFCCSVVVSITACEQKALSMGLIWSDHNPLRSFWLQGSFSFPVCFQYRFQSRPTGRCVDEVTAASTRACGEENKLPARRAGLF